MTSPIRPDATSRASTNGAELLGEQQRRPTFSATSGSRCCHGQFAICADLRRRRRTRRLARTRGPASAQQPRRVAPLAADAAVFLGTRRADYPLYQPPKASPPPRASNWAFAGAALPANRLSVSVWRLTDLLLERRHRPPRPATQSWATSRLPRAGPCPRPPSAEPLDRVLGPTLASHIASATGTEAIGSLLINTAAPTPERSVDGTRK